ncbi:uncharacterized protein LOC132556412 [Ylistrum balloti]|uniref:uncharacterized protein LOC132556412 n=1 Tax=Ylistrum balloti TaxID=509963 RepID=UPI0029059669|nr:uncharacterized protein LOC132556412 [Ylistrum balloti]
MFVVFSMLVTLLGSAHGHGYLKDPPNRSSMWRFGFQTPKNYDDNQLFCGGLGKQKYLGGKCGLCGDAYDQPAPRDNEAGGKYAKGIITKHYTQDSTIDITVLITTNHLGYFEFRLCENNDVTKTITKDCLKHLLVNPNTGETRHYIGSVKGDIVTRVQLPQGVTCSQCILQWRYHTENRWGTNETGHDCLGCGPQEEFYGCSDIAITGDGNTVATTTLTTILKSSSAATTTAAAATTTAAAVTTTEAAATTTAKQQTTTPKNKLSCKAISAPADDNYCNSNCNTAPYHCPPEFCLCNGTVPTAKGRFIKLLLTGLIVD